MSKAFLGPRLRRLREERGLTQSAAARALEVSPSYYNQLENNQRPLTVQLVVRISALFGVDVQFFSEEDEGRLASDVREALAASAPDDQLSAAELRELVSSLPAVGRALVTMHARYREALERAEALAHRMGERGTAPTVELPLMPYEEVRDFFYARHNYIGELDERAEQLAQQAGLQPGEMADGLTRYLAERHGVRTTTAAPGDQERTLQRLYDPDARLLELSPNLLPGQRAFQLATQLAFLAAGEQIAGIVEAGGFSSDEARRLARIGLAHHFAGALLMPYRIFLGAAEQMRYDIDRLRRLFAVSYETTCHRLSTLQRPGAPGVPFFFMRVDRAGNISKRQSATDFHFSRVGGTCPLWNVYEAFAQPQRILRQIAQMPDGRTYLWIARAVSRSQGGFGTPSKTYAIGLGCDLRHASRLVYSQGLDLKDPRAATPIGMGCKVCERSNCPQRAFPPIGHKLAVDERETRFEPYAVE